MKRKRKNLIRKRILTYLNSAASPFDLMTIPMRPMSMDQMADMGAAPPVMEKGDAFAYHCAIHGATDGVGMSGTVTVI